MHPFHPRAYLKEDGTIPRNRFSPVPGALVFSKRRS